MLYLRTFSCGHAIIAVNVIGVSWLQNISIFHTRNIAYCVKKLGGIFWLYKNAHGPSNINDVTLTIRDCIVSNTHKHVHTEMLQDHEWSSSIGLIFQHGCNCSKVAVNMFNINISNVTSINQSLVFISNSIVNTFVTLFNSSFNNNTVASVFSMISSPNTSTSLCINNTLFNKNIVHKKLFSVLYVNPTIEGNVSFVQNVANVIMSLNDYIVMAKKSTLVFDRNQYNPSEISIQRFIIERQNKSLKCPIQFTKYAHTTSTITFCDNEQYYKEVYADIFLDNCTWNNTWYLKKFNFTPRHVYNIVMHMCANEPKTFSFGRGSMICQCDSVNKTCLNFIQNPISLGQTATLSMVHARFNISVYTDFTDNRFANVAPTCELVEYNASHPKVNIVFQQCTKLSFTITSNTTQIDQCILVLKTATKKSFISAISIPVKDCPIGFTINADARLCQCNPQLAAKVTGIICRISDEKIKLPPKGWISVVKNSSEIIYATNCQIVYCLRKSHFISLSEPDTQCLPSRAGLLCGQCKKGLALYLVRQNVSSVPTMDSF